MELTKEDQYAVVKYLYKKGKGCNDIRKELILVCGSNALDFDAITIFVLKLQNESFITQVQESTLKDEKIDKMSCFKVQVVMLKYCRASVEFICARTNISYESVLEITNNLKLTNVYTRWMPTTFDIKDKLQRVVHCANMLLRYHLKQDFLERMIIMQEIWLPVFNVKKESAQCYSLSVRKDTSEFKCEDKLIRVIFWDQKGVIFDHSIQKDTYVTDKYYENIIQNDLLPAIAKMRPKLVDKIILYHDNTKLNNFIYKFELNKVIESIDVPYSSPDLFPGDFWFSRALRLSLEQKEYPSIPYVESAIQNWYEEIPITTFEHIYKKMIMHWEHCLRYQGESLINMRL